MEIVGVEPTTLCLQSRCSSQLSYTPKFLFLLSVCCVGLRILFRSLPLGNSLFRNLSALHPSQNKQKFTLRFQTALACVSSFGQTLKIFKNLWEQRESNPRPSACKADALNQLSYAPIPQRDCKGTQFFFTSKFFLQKLLSNPQKITPVRKVWFDLCGVKNIT